MIPQRLLLWNAGKMQERAGDFMLYIPPEVIEQAKILSEKERWS